VKPPNWFLVLVAFCLVVLTALAFTVVVRESHDWERDGQDFIFDRKTGVLCAMDTSSTASGFTTGCVDMRTGERLRAGTH
jgi:hypothetical protein